MRPLITLVLSLILAACGSAQMTPAPSAQAGAHAAQVQAPYLVTFDLPRDTWKAGEPITGSATLTLVQGAGADIGGEASGVFGFEYASVDGLHDVRPASDLVCKGYRLVAGAPLSQTLDKSGGFAPELPDFEFLRTFLTAPDTRLPAGDWKITAVADFVEGQGCSGASRTIRATVTIHVTP